MIAIIRYKGVFFMKKLFSLLLAALIIVCGVVPAFASGSRPVVFTLTAPGSVSVGDRVEVALSVSGDYTAHILRLNVYFETRSFRFESAAAGDVYMNAVMNKSAMAQNALANDGRSVNMAIIMPIDALTEEGLLLTITFTALQTATTSSEFTVSVEEFGYMPIGQMFSSPISSTVGNATINIQGASEEPVETTKSPIAATGQPNATPEPGATPDPSESDMPEVEETSEPATSDTPGEHLASQSPDNTEDTEAKPGSSSRIVILIYVGCGVLLAAAVAAAIIIARKKR